MIIAAYSNNPKFKGYIEPKFYRLHEGETLTAMRLDGSTVQVLVKDGKLYAV